MPTVRLAVALAATLLAPALSHACQFETDCEPGSRCVKEYGRLDGACVGGLFPGADRRSPSADRQADRAASNQQTIDGVSNIANFVWSAVSFLARKATEPAAVVPAEPAAATIAATGTPAAPKPSGFIPKAEFEARYGPPPEGFDEQDTALP